MPKQFIYLSLSYIILLLSCNSKKQTVVESRISEEKKSFFPVTDFIRGQLSELDSLQVTPLKLISFGGKTDSVWIKREDIRKFASPFLTPVIDTVNLNFLFEEKSFLDQTINAFTFSYDPIGPLPDTIRLRRWDVYVDPQKQLIKRIYLVKEEKNEGKVKTIQLTWLPGLWAKITTIPEGTDDPKLVKEEKVIWNFDKEQY